MTRKKRKRKLKISRIFLVLILLGLIVFGIFLLSKMKVKGYYIVGNTYYTDNQILEKTGLDKYPSYLFTNSIVINRRVRNDNLINNIEIKHKINGMFEVIINENKILYYDDIKRKSVLNNKKTVDYYNENIPVLVNEINNKKVYEKFLIKLDRLNDNIIKNISEIKYEPNDLDKERFLLSMNDGNYVYVTLSKFSNINNYLEISNTLGDRKGILYLDYGNYFVPKE